MVVPLVQEVVAKAPLPKVMQKKTFLVLLFFSQFSCAQKDTFNSMVNKAVSKTIPFISVDSLKQEYDSFQILDCREKKEFDVSHLKNAKHVGYSKFDVKKTCAALSKNTPVVVYCTVGYRSEKIAEQLEKKGLKVFNLYGGIFQWKNNGNQVFNNAAIPTEKVHCFNKKWSQWLLRGEKTYD